MPSTRFERFQPLAGVLSGLLLIAGLALTWGDPSSETGIDETFSYWADNRGQHQISGLLLAPLIAFLLVFFGVGLRRHLRHERDAGHGSVAFGGALLAASTFALVGMLEGAATNAAHEGERSARPHAEPAALVRLAGPECRLRRGPARDGPGSAAKRSAPRSARLAHARHRRVAPDAARARRVPSAPALADRRRSRAHRAQGPAVDRVERGPVQLRLLRRRGRPA